MATKLACRFDQQPVRFLCSLVIFGIWFSKLFRKRASRWRVCEKKSFKRYETIAGSQVISNFARFELVSWLWPLRSGRPYDITKMAVEELKEEKLSMQRELLKYERSHGRPSTREEKQTMRDVYDRYRDVKRILAAKVIDEVRFTKPDWIGKKSTKPSQWGIIQTDTVTFWAYISSIGPDARKQVIRNVSSRVT